VKSGFWTKDWFTALVVIVAVLTLSRATDFVRGLELAVYDFGVRGAQREPSERVAVIAIDDKSIENIGRWPWPRSQQAEMIAALQQAGAKVVGNQVFYIEPGISPGMDAITQVGQFVEQSGIGQAIADSVQLGELLNTLDASDVRSREAQEFFAASALNGALAGDFGGLLDILDQASQMLDSDRILGQVFKEGGNVILPAFFVPGEPYGNPDKPLPDYMRANRITAVQQSANNAGAPIIAIQGLAPVAGIGDQALAIGALAQSPDPDGGLRADPLVIAYYEGSDVYGWYPSFALQIAAASLNLTVDDIKVTLGEGVQLGRLNIGTDSEMRMLSFFYSDGAGGSAFKPDSFFDVATGAIKLDKYKDKIVLLGPTAKGLGDSFSTPVQPLASPLEIMAHLVSSILQEDFFTQPPWGIWATLAAVLLIAIYLLALLPKLRAGPAVGITIALIVVLLGTEAGLLVGSTLWIELALPTFLLVVGHAILTTKRFLVTERGKMAADMESAESNKSLGLALQAKGDYDMAFERFRRLRPIDDSVLDLLYHLAPEFERKRQHAKAGAVYEYIAQHNPKFRDVATKMNRSKALEETVLLGGGGGGGGAQATLLMDGSIEKPMLGRYEVEKELGKGAMGIVYLGKDPKINRVVAIKTMALAQEFEAEELQEVKERFFREAETAGRLSHPNIVTIFDAGEEHDLAYIAMEFLKGKDLVPHTKPDNLLPLDEVLDIVIDSAKALDYAHKLNVVHRDIKPANIMYEPETHTTSLTDFGIARITDSSKTKTGMVLGTPSYMSPEQLSGKKVDGRSDLFSLGVMLFQMVSGQLPFRGDSMATLMFGIANEPHPDIREIKQDLPEALKAIIDKSLSKTPEDRYQDGAEMAQDLSTCKAILRSQDA
jgi:eukaryotic-like serine/threonine-protein kinase